MKCLPCDFKERYTAREFGAVLAHATALSTIRTMNDRLQLDLFRNRAAERREWVAILAAAVEARADG